VKVRVSVCLQIEAVLVDAMRISHCYGAAGRVLQ
jgi:hypothetical protein